MIVPIEENVLTVQRGIVKSLGVKFCAVIIDLNIFQQMKNEGSEHSSHLGWPSSSPRLGEYRAGPVHMHRARSM